MPSGLTSADRRLIIGASSVAVAIVLVMLVFAPPVDQDSPVPSIYSATASGARAAYLLVRELGYQVREWEEPLSELPQASEGKLLVLADPDEIPSPQDRKTLHDFVARGGRVLFCGKAVSSFFREARIQVNPDPRDQKFTAKLPGALTRGARTISMIPEARWLQEHDTELAVYGDAVVAWRIGKGQVIWWAAASPLTNIGLKRDDNLTFFLDELNDPASGKRLTILWDEYFHGQRTGLLNYAERTPLPWAGVQFAILAAFVIFTFSRRSGPVMLPFSEPRLSPLEFVDTMGGLYQRAGASSIPVDVYYQNLRTELARRLNLPRTGSNTVLAESAGARLGISERNLSDALHDAERFLGLSISGTKVSARDALAIVQKLAACSAQLRSPIPLQEKN